MASFPRGKPSGSRFRRVGPARVADRETRGGRLGTTGNKTPRLVLPGIEWAIEDTVNIQPGFPVATVRRKNDARGARGDIDAGVRRLPHSAPTSKLGVYTWQSRHFGVSTRLRGFIFTHAHGGPRTGSAAGQTTDKRPPGRDLSAMRRKLRAPSANADSPDSTRRCYGRDRRSDRD